MKHEKVHFLGDDFPYLSHLILKKLKLLLLIWLYLVVLLFNTNSDNIYSNKNTGAYLILKL